MIHAILALVFLTKLFLSSRFSAPKYISSHYGHQVLKIDNDLSISRNVSSNKMIHAILALVFLTKLFLSSRFSAPKYISSHYGHQVLKIDNDLSISRNISSNKMIHAILALVFLTKLFLSSRFSAPKNIHFHFFQVVLKFFTTENILNLLRVK